MDFLDAIVRWAREAPERVAHVSGDRRLTYAELTGRAAALARWLDDEVSAGPVAIVGHREVEMPIAMLGCALANRAYVPIDDAVPASRVARIAEIAGVSATLTPADVAHVAPRPAPPPGSRPRHADDLYYVMFTSGSSGEPKGVRITRGCLQAFVDWVLGEQHFGPDEVFINPSNFSFDLSVLELYGALVTGGTVVSIPRHAVTNPRALFALLRESEATTWVSTPTFAGLCLSEPTFGREMLSRLRRLLFCGEGLPVETASALLARFPGAAMWNLYGPTEATVATTSMRIDEATVAAGHPLPVGRPMPGVTIDVVDDDGACVPDGERGELVIRGPNVSTGYLNRSALTAAAFFERDGQRAYRTGDWARRRHGLLYVEGRKDSQIKLRGYRIELGEVEWQLRATDGVRDAVVAPVMRDGRPWALSAMVVADQQPGDELAAADAVRRRLAERLPEYMVPRQIRFVDRLPMTANGKVDRREVADLLGASRDALR